MFAILKVTRPMWKYIVLPAIAMLFVPGAVSAQPPPLGMELGMHAGWSGPQDDMMPGGMMPSKRRERMEMVMIWRLTEYLDLDTEQADTFFPAMRAHRQAMEELDSERRELVADYRKQLDAGKVDAGDVETLIVKLEKIDHARIKMRSENMKNMKKSLSADQWAKFVIFEDQFKHQIRQKINRGDLEHPKRGDRRRFLR